MTSMTAAMTPTFQPTRTAPLLIPALLACYLVWGSTYLAIQIALVSFPPFFQMGTRFLTAGLLLMAWVLLKKHKLPTRREWRNALIIGALMLGGGMGLTASAEVHVGSGMIAAFIAEVPMLMSALGALLGQRPSRLELLGMTVGLVGVILLVRGASFTAAPVGLVCIAGASLLWSVGSVLSTTRLPLASGPAGFASQMLCGGAVLMLISFALGEHTQAAKNWPAQPTAILAWVYLVVFGSLIAFSAYMYLLANASPAMASSYAFVNPLIAIFLGAFFANELVTGNEWFACAVILAGVFLIFRGKSTTSRHK